PGERTLNLDWSARGMTEPGGLRFDLRVPACPVATLDLDLPADREPAVPREGGLLTGPLPGAGPDRRVWRLVFGPGSQIDLTVRPRDGAARPGPLVLARQRPRQELSPGQAVCEFAFDLEVLHGGLRGLTIECDPALRPTEVAVRNLERWERQPGPTPDAPARISVRLREPLQGSTLTLRAVAAAPPGRPWVSPGARVLRAVRRGETLTLLVHPALRFSESRSR